MPYAQVNAILELKRKVCTADNKKTFVVINQKGIDPLSLDALCKEGIMALRRAKVCALFAVFLRLSSSYVDCSMILFSKPKLFKNTVV